LEQSDPKKARERKILELVYANRSVADIVPSERPDFIIHRHDGTMFGVEIAELYHSETDARLERIPDYYSELLNGGNFRHRDDARLITVGKIDILTPSNEVVCSQVEAIIQEVRSPAECALSLGAMVRSKAAKLAQHQPALSHINLIVHDRTNILGHIPREDCWLANCVMPQVYRILARRDSHGGTGFGSITGRALPTARPVETGVQFRFVTHHVRQPALLVRRAVLALLEVRARAGEECGLGRA